MNVRWIVVSFLVVGATMSARAAPASSGVRRPGSDIGVAAITVDYLVDRSDNVQGLPCTAAASDCTLRSAIQLANSGSFKNIRFDPAITLIQPSSVGLPSITGQGTWIDGGNSVLVDGRNIASGDVFDINASDVTISQISVNNAPVSSADIGIDSGHDARIAYDSLGLGTFTCNGLTRSGEFGVLVQSPDGGPGTGNGSAYIWGNTIGCHTEYGIWVIGSGYGGIGLQPDGVTISGNYVGTDGIQTVNNGGDGIRVTNASHASVTGNVISGNSGAGVLVEDASSDYATITGNTIGLGSDQLTPIGNGTDGVFLTNSGSFATIDSNVISRNAQTGVHITGASTNQPEISHNTIGLAGNGQDIVGNDGTGLQIDGGAKNSFVHDNTISGNGMFGVKVDGSGGGNDIDQGNYIGLTGDGKAAAPNHDDGIFVVNDASGNNRIGDESEAGVNNTYIAGNNSDGIFLESSSGWTIGYGARIGVNVDGTPLGNGLDGIFVQNSNPLSVHPGNVSNNGGAGVAIVGSNVSANLAAIHPMTIEKNGGLPIDLGNDGPTLNGQHPCPCPNDWVKYPVITSANGSNIVGTTCGFCRVDVYQAAGNPAADGGGGVYLQTSFADTVGDWIATLPAGLTASDITMVATDHNGNGNSSEMSPLFASATPTPSPSPTPTTSTSPTPSPSPTPTATGGAAIAGDANCDDAVTDADLLATLADFAGVQHAACHNRADVDCNNAVDVRDGLRIVRYLAGVPMSAPNGCSQVGSPVT